MAEYTNIETAMEIICGLCKDLYPDEDCPGKCDWMEYLKEDAADVAPVVRCKDCKHRYNDSWCEYVDDDDNFYCARGERKNVLNDGC